MDDVRLMDAAGAGTKAEWMKLVDEIGEEAGYFEPLGQHHNALFFDAGTTLLVSFESLSALRASHDSQMPLGQRIAARHGWSSLTIIADGETWYRDPAVYGYFDRLVDDAFFEDFDRVVFYGAGMGAYAACAYSVTSPGATVLAVQPVATLDPALAGWDDRFREMRRLCFTDRYGYGPDMLDGAARAFMLYDPHEPLDAMHAALYHRPFVTALPCPLVGPEVEPVLSRMGILEELIEATCEARLTRELFYRLFRARRETTQYLRTLLGRLEREDRLVLAALLCRAVTSDGGRPRFRNRLRDLEQKLAEQGITLPPSRDARDGQDG